MTILDTPVIAADYRSLALDQVAKHWPQFDPTEALDAALAWLASADGGYPGDLADTGWHALILASTSRYAELCDRLVGRFIHHEATGDRKDPCGRSCGPCEQLQRP